MLQQLNRAACRSIRDDTVFIPCHWADKKSANLLTIRALDPISRIPEYKVCAVRVRRATPEEDAAARAEPGVEAHPVASDRLPYN